MKKTKEHPRVCDACKKRFGHKGRRGICPESHFDKGERLKEKEDDRTK